MQDGYDQTLSGLLRKRAELAAEATALRTAFDTKLAELDTIDAAIRVFNPSIAPSDIPERRAPVPHSEATSEIRRFLIDQMRKAEPRPLRTMEATAALFEARGIDVRDRVVTTLLRKRVTDAFGRMRKAGMVEGRKFGSGSEQEWRLV
ncbi:hypothetical protein [Sphingomonas sp. 28-63-12]|uniref:hypothetical protein n=1 Tax=Sphingomonas sp. 28-63-12 TaxID=1970434 RepID=UPI000BC38AF6|nr:MAG: hypothetical protein B7Y47_08205 [Sphingomonas sp. 28-63-12]